jgi:hypothetical protein
MPEARVVLKRRPWRTPRHRRHFTAGQLVVVDLSGHPNRGMTLCFEVYLSGAPLRPTENRQAERGVQRCGLVRHLRRRLQRRHYWRIAAKLYESESANHRDAPCWRLVSKGRSLRQKAEAAVHVKIAPTACSK